jgi:hypothetical protein
MNRFRRVIVALLLAGLGALGARADEIKGKTAEIQAKEADKLAAAVKEAGAKFAAAAQLHNDDAASRRAFLYAVLSYGKVERMHGETPKLRLMEGNGSFLGNKLPYAIFFYRCGLAGEPDDPDLLRGLDHARAHVAYSSPEEREALTPKTSVFQRFKLQVHHWGPIYIAVAGLFGWLALGRWIIRRKPLLFVVAMIALLATGSLVAVWLVVHSEREEAVTNTDRYGVVLKAAILREGDGQSYAPVRPSPIPSGVEVRILLENGWVQVELADGTVGWLPGDCLIRVTSGQPFLGSS